MESLKPLDSIERLDGLVNALDIGSPKYKEYMRILNELAGSHDAKKLKEAEYALSSLGLKLGVAATLNPSPTPPLNSELQYANERGLTIEKCEDGYWRWFKPDRK